MDVRRVAGRFLSRLPVHSWMLLGATAIVLVSPLLSAALETIAIHGIAPWYWYFILWPPMLLCWGWIRLGWPGRVWVELGTYFVICILAAYMTARWSPVQAVVELSAFLILPMVGVFYRRWEIVLAATILGILIELAWFNGFLPGLPAPLARDSAGLSYADAVLFGAAGLLDGVIARVLKQREDHLIEQERRYRLLADNSADLIALHGPDGRLAYASPAWSNVLGYETDAWKGLSFLSICHFDDLDAVETSLRAARAGRPARVVHRLRHRDGRYVWFDTVVRRAAEPEDGPLRLQSASRDVTERRAFEEQLRHQADHDPLTDQANRTLFLRRLNEALAAARVAGRRVAVLFLDLDNFKHINDSLGHSTGDRLLVAVAQRIRRLLAEEDMLARLGGDELAIILEPGREAEDPATVAARIERDLRLPFHLMSRDVYVTASTGIVISDGGYTTAEEVMRNADLAMYDVKRGGKAGHRIYDRHMSARSEARLQFDGALRLALRNGEFVLHYQPIVTLADQRPAGFEALIRWQHPTKGLLPPAQFIPVAEENGLIVPISRWVLVEACRQARLWEQRFGAANPLFISVNLSAQQFQSAGVVGDIQAALEATGASPASLCVEITESALLVAERSTANVLQRVRDLGVRLVIDDFGTGYANFSYLQKFRVDALKIDRSFIARLPGDPEETAIVRSLLTLANDLHIEVTGEGIETDKQLAHLLAQHCRYGQGYLFSRPVPARQATEYLSTWAAVRCRR